MSACRRCYHEEQHGGTSRRHRSNQKSAIFIQSFDHSFEQSPGRQHFDVSGHTDTLPIDLHIDLGNYCNLSCKMCNAQSSSQIAAQEVKWGIESSRQFLKHDWTRDPVVWQNFLQQLLTIPKLQNIHFMGGETLLTDRLEQVVDFMIEHQRFEVCFSFVTNGTVFNPGLLDKLAKFKRVGIEVSIETVDQHNAYQRQGTDTNMVLENIKRYQTYCKNANISVALRPAVSALTIGYYAGLLKYALEHQLLIISLFVLTPKFLDIAVLPSSVKNRYLKSYCELLEELDEIPLPPDYNAANHVNYREVIKKQALMCVNILQQPEPQHIEQLQQSFVAHCAKWDQVHGYNARDLYPELKQLWDAHGYPG